MKILERLEHWFKLDKMCTGCCLWCKYFVDCWADYERGNDNEAKNEQGQTVYYNPVIKQGKERYIILAASGQIIQGRDGQRLKSRTFAQEHQAEAWLKRHGYTIAI